MPNLRARLTRCAGVSRVLLLPNGRESALFITTRLLIDRKGATAIRRKIRNFSRARRHICASYFCGTITRRSRVYRSIFTCTFSSAFPSIFNITFRRFDVGTEDSINITLFFFSPVEYSECILLKHDRHVCYFKVDHLSLRSSAAKKFDIMKRTGRGHEKAKLRK